MGLVVHLVSLKVDLGYVIDNLVPLLVPSEQPLKSRFRLLNSFLLLLFIDLIGIVRRRLSLLVRRDELLGFTLQLI